MYSRGSALLRPIQPAWYARYILRRASVHFLFSRPFLKTYLLFLENDQKTQRK